MSEHFALYEHQRTGADYLVSRGHAYLGDAPGLGKTRTVLEAVRRAKDLRALVFAPAAVRNHWHREAMRLGVYDRVEVYSYDAVVDGGDELQQRILHGVHAPHILVLDEAHYTKHATSQRTRRILGKGGYAREIPIVWAASGTPVPKHAGEFWTILSTLWPEVALAHGLRTYDDWANRFLVTTPRWTRGIFREKIVGQKNEDELRAIYDATILRRTLADVGIDVPEIWWQPLDLQLPSDVSVGASSVGLTADAVDAIIAGELQSIEHDPEVARARRRLGELKAPLVVRYLVDTLGESDEKVVVFAHHLNVLSLLKDGLRDAGLGSVTVTGDSSLPMRDAMIERFVGDANVRVFLGQNTAVGTGTDGLQHAASRAILVEPSWSAYENVQMGHRVARTGSTHDHAIVQMATLAGTLDDFVVTQNLRETQMADAVGLGEART